MTKKVSNKNGQISKRSKSNIKYSSMKRFQNKTIAGYLFTWLADVLASS
jgi:hypothetical protein